MRRNYDYGYKPKRRIKPIPVAIAVLAVVVIVGGLYYLIFGRQSKYSDYNEYNETNKKYGTVEQYTSDNDDFYESIYYPKFDDKNLNTIVKDTYKEFIKDEKKKKDQKDVLYMDYSCEKIYKQYVVIKYDFQRVDEKTEKSTKKKKVMTYNLKTKELLTLKDCLRGKYGDLLAQYGIQNFDKNSTSIQIGKNSMVYYPNKDMKDGADIEYEKNKDYIKLANKNIPSDAPLDVKAPKTMKIDKKKKMVAITLDDGPHKVLTDRAMKAFEKHKGRATFFELGSTIKLYPQITKDVYERGFEIGSHTYSHATLSKLDAATLDKEIKDTQDLVFSITGIEPTLIRPPYGARNDAVRAAFKSYGLQNILWDGDTEDWRLSKTDGGAQQVCDNIIRDAKAGTGNGNIVLIHDIHQNSVTGLEMALDQLDKDGYQFVTVSDLLKYQGHKDFN